MSPAKPDFSPATIGMGQRRRLCAALEGLAEKYDVCAAAIPSFQVCVCVFALLSTRLAGSRLPSLNPPPPP